jgi:hypothetical protein
MDAERCGGAGESAEVRTPAWRDARVDADPKFLSFGSADAEELCGAAEISTPGAVLRGSAHLRELRALKIVAR